MEQIAISIQKLFQLRFLYYQRLFGEKYTQNFGLPFQNHRLNLPKTSLQNIVENCSLCERSKSAKPSFGFLPLQAKIIFITELPLINTSGVFLSNKSSEMLQNIIQNVFSLQTNEYGVISMLKCDENNSKIHESEVTICKQYLNEQIIQASAKAVVLLGQSVLSHFLGLEFDLYNGRILPQGNKSFIATYSLGQLLKNPSLKKEAMKHFLLIKTIV